MEIATLGGGCFWCLEAVFQQIKGVHEVVSGYAGGSPSNPTYEKVCSGTTGHAEVVQIKFEPSVVSYSTLLQVFWRIHDPTTPNRQGADIGTQYRSIIFYHDGEQLRVLKEVRKEIEDLKVWEAPIITEVEPFTAFYAAEAYHQDYYRNNSLRPYCTFVIAPKLEAFSSRFPSLVRAGA